MGDKQNCDTLYMGFFNEHMGNFSLNRRVKAGGWFVRYKKEGRKKQGPNQSKSLKFSTCELARVPMEQSF